MLVYLWQCSIRLGVIVMVLIFVNGPRDLISFCAGVYLACLS